MDVPTVTDQDDPRERIRMALIAAGLSRAQPQPWIGPRPLSTAERATLARQVAAGRPLSEIIDEEREGR